MPENTKFTIFPLLTLLLILGLISVPAVFEKKPESESLSPTERLILVAPRNAQQLASVCNTAQAAGHNFIVDGDMLKTVENIVEGVEIDNESSNFHGVFFGVPNLSKREQYLAAGLLEIDSFGELALIGD